MQISLMNIHTYKSISTTFSGLSVSNNDGLFNVPELVEEFS